MPYLARVLRSLRDWYEQQGCGAEAEQARAEARQLLEDLPVPPVRLLSGFLSLPDEPQPSEPALLSE